MSNLVTFEQAMLLKKHGFREKTFYHFTGENPIVNIELKDWNEDEYSSWVSRPTISDALDWIREEKGIKCGVYPSDLGYKFRYIPFDTSRIKSISSQSFKSHPIASSALLDSILTYLEKKK